MQYLAIKDAIEEQIESGMLEIGHKLPSERTLAEAFSTTRITLREALYHLELSGKIYREERRGWFVSSKGIVLNPMVDLDLAVLCSNQKRRYIKTTLNAHKVLAPKAIANALQLTPFSYVLALSSVISIDSRKVAIQYQYIPVERFPKLQQPENEPSIMTYLKDHYLCQADLITMKIGVQPAELIESTALNISSGSMLFSVKQTVHDSQGKAFLYQVTNWCHDAVNIEG
ncbi:GntR family transcriptional regulator [Aliivibrio salmonicida]|jgi:DNA-binding GntR family transcriptional regulator|uniref:Transcription regulator, GntR family n=1 Tax=Aliivibrio salmonicida (strain LFI1238) TaxID=316275 RepID=B6EHT1_ALISL|nr:UTRA domain-containing protein [Aliivibrio salmonicida]AZL85235.1 GntR family transcriptional regulator [Aliivibrio salmonicida]CAQ79744.1 transcription regulator, GntR family [Aliivibrio salmonicida LFI1238]